MSTGKARSSRRRLARRVRRRRARGIGGLSLCPISIVAMNTDAGPKINLAYRRIAAMGRSSSLCVADRAARGWLSCTKRRPRHRYIGSERDRDKGRPPPDSIGGICTRHGKPSACIAPLTRELGYKTRLMRLLWVNCPMRPASNPAAAGFEFGPNFGHAGVG